ncbi:MAG: DUF134 domain-containing protein [Desulfovibrio desulfuricans]|jgi:predicted DNA-binding protein (UPF0251 family)/predicted Fe-Mo cluster-binding NifX family protein|uniref:DUF134 domain-containing protein n=1 Tax=uncultured Desulfovibrio sp. TaxID=167968 RepID=UPI001B01A512|nr:DUF134 domain-containing protein [uncultured Desulfovibrio sp.]MBE6441533.1 DUF134 domain-containing protein [Desulfovibrio desulfuricans]MBO5489897.1 DUF134 domain-containing protein [Desulfovibrio sp.]
MARPRHCRYVAQQPGATYFKPCGVPLRLLDEVRLPVEGLEALRLSDMEGLNMSEAAARVRVSRFTYARTLAAARRAVAEALVAGKALRIGGGAYAFVDAPGAPPCRRERSRSMPIVAISSEGPSLDDAVDPRYGRAGGFIIAACPESGDEPEISYLDNGDAQLLPQGAGIATTEHLVNAGVTVVISGYVGPKAFEALQAAGISVIQDMDGMSAGEALRRWRAGCCREALAPNHEAGM